MKNVFNKLPVYTGDVSGAAAALYELGGMSVIHDPSGCNSTYNTHDETRWYSENSLIFISGLSEVDAITGNDDKFIRDVLDAAEKLKPKFIALFNSPVPYINGTDFKGIAKIIEKKSNIPCFHIETNAMHDYSVGISNAFYELAVKFLPEKKKACEERRDGVKKINIIGMTPLDFAAKGSEETIRKIFEKENFFLNSVWAMGSSFEEIMKSPEADINLVISSAGIKTAEFMREKYGIPYIIGTPVGKYTKKIIKKLRESPLENSFLSDKKYSGEVVIVGETILSLSLAEEYELRTGERAEVIATTELGHEFLRESDKAIVNEKEIAESLKGYKKIIADPLYKRVAPKDADFEEIVHLAFSGRLFLKRAKNVFEGETE